MPWKKVPRHSSPRRGRVGYAHQSDDAVYTMTVEAAVKPLQKAAATAVVTDKSGGKAHERAG
jgi:hypothetical protein